MFKMGLKKVWLYANISSNINCDEEKKVRGLLCPESKGNAETFAIILLYNVVSEHLNRKSYPVWIRSVGSNGMAHVTVRQVRETLPLEAEIARFSANQGGTTKCSPFVPIGLAAVCCRPRMRGVICI